MLSIQLEKVFNEIDSLDQYTQMSIYGSFAFALNSSCLNQAMKFIPDVEEGSGIDGYTPYEQARHNAMRTSEESYLPALIALRREIAGRLDNVGGSGSLERTYEYICSNPPRRRQFETEFENRRRAGMRGGIKMKDFVDGEMAVAMKRHDQLVAKGDDAIRLCETLPIDEDRGYNDAPEWVLDSLIMKVVTKCKLRWQKLELDRTNMRLPKMRRDAASADQLFIEDILKQYGEDNPADQTPEASVTGIRPGFEFDDPIPFGNVA
jgi:hypothetical protein